MSAFFVLLRRELQAFLRTPTGFVIAAIVLLIDGLLFNSFALGVGKRLSADVIRDFFYFSSGTTIIAAILLSMKLFAEERQTGTLVLLRTSPISEGQVVLAKYAAALIYLGFITLLTLPMPLLVMVHGKISIGHLCAGYLGLFLLGSACVAIGTFSSAIAENQMVAAIVSTAIIVFLLMAWMLARVTEPPLSDFIAHLALFDKHYQPFMRGMLHSRDLVYYLSLTYFFLLLATHSSRLRRWS